MSDEEEEVQAAFPDRYRDGMTLRDYFAAQAMQGLLANPECPLTPLDEVPQASYALADAMMKAREA